MAILPQILFVIGLAGLVVWLVTTCIKFTKGPLDTAALKNQLRLLQLKFVSASLINPEAERKEIELLQNKIKTSSNPTHISGDKDLKLLFASNCRHIQSAMSDVHLAERSSWIKFRELMVSFSDFYFRT